MDTTTPASARLWRWLLAPGFLTHSPAARLRGLARELDWRQADRRRRAGLVRTTLARPLTTWRAAGAEVARTGREVASVTGITPAAQRRHMWWLTMRHGLDPLSYPEYRLYEPERRRVAARYVQETEHTRLLRFVHRQAGDHDARIFKDKRRFAEWCQEHALPAVQTVLEMDEGAIVAGGLPLPRRDLFWKPADATSGHGVERWQYRGADQWQASDGRVVDEAGLLAALAHLSRTLELRERRTSRRMLLQLGLTNHRDLARLAPGALSTARIVVYRWPGGPPIVLRAAFRLAVGTAPADNYAVGGMVAPVDLATGSLLFGVQRVGGVLRQVHRHPDSGATISGFRLPCWPEAVALALRGLAAAPDMPVIGWDVALTDDGPILVEGNMAPNPGLLQKHTGEPLSDTDLPAAVMAHVQRRLG